MLDDEADTSGALDWSGVYHPGPEPMDRQRKDLPTLVKTVDSQDTSDMLRKNDVRVMRRVKELSSCNVPTR